MDRLKKYGNMTPRDNVVLRFVDHNICGPLIYPRPLQGSTLLKINELSVLWICCPDLWYGAGSLSLPLSIYRWARSGCPDLWHGAGSLGAGGQ